MRNSYKNEDGTLTYCNDVDFLKHLTDKIKQSRQEGNQEQADSIWDFYSDVYKDIYGMRPKYI